MKIEKVSFFNINSFVDISSLAAGGWLLGLDLEEKRRDKRKYNDTLYCLCLVSLEEKVFPLPLQHKPYRLVLKHSITNYY